MYVTGILLELLKKCEQEHDYPDCVNKIMKLNAFYNHINIMEISFV